MARKDRSLAGFGEVANENNNVDNNVNNDENVNVNKTEGEQQEEATAPDYLDTLLEEGGSNKKKDELVLTGVYLQRDIAKILDRLGKKGGRGAKSRIVNDALKKLFSEKGLI